MTEPARAATIILLVILAGLATAILIRLGTMEGDAAMGCGCPCDCLQESEPGPEAILHEVCNECCPVDGRPVREGVRMVEAGLAIGLCCGGCARQVREDPPRALERLLAEPEAGPPLRRFLAAHPEVRRTFTGSGR